MNLLQKAASYFRPVEQKSNNFNYSSFVNFLHESGHSDLGNFISIDLYSKVAPLATAVNIIADSIADLKPIVVDSEGNRVEHPVLELLKNPNSDQTKTEFLKRFAAFLIITGDNFTIANGNVNAPPLEIVIPSPQTASIAEDMYGEAGGIRITKKAGAFEFVKGANMRFYSGTLREIWHTKTFNPFPDALTGQSPLTPIYFDIEQYKQSSQHNLSILKRGARPSGVFLSKTALTDDQYTRLKAQVDTFFSGSTQAGRPMLADGDGIDFKEMMLTPRDMDFLKLKENVTIAIFNQLKIPLPLVTPEQQTFANMASANLQLFDNAVMPLADRIFEELSLFLLPRYKGSENVSITYSKEDIEALDVRTTGVLESRSKLGIYTINELRTIDGMEAVEGGDEILRPATELPIARDMFTEDQLQKPATRSKFFDIMRKNTDLPQEELEVIANKHGLN